MSVPCASGQWIQFGYRAGDGPLADVLTITALPHDFCALVCRRCGKSAAQVYFERSNAGVVAPPLPLR